MSMTLDGFIAGAFPLAGRLDQAACGHPFLNAYQGSDVLNLKGAFNDFRPLAVEGRSHVYLGREPTGEEARGYRSLPPSWFERNDTYRALNGAFRIRLRQHLEERLGRRYAEFEKRAGSTDIFTRSAGRVSVAAVSELGAIARDVMYLVDAEKEIAALRGGGGAPAVGAVDKSHPEALCDRCLERAVPETVGRMHERIVANAPPAYARLLGRLVDEARSATADAPGPDDVVAAATPEPDAADRADDPSQVLLSGQVASDDMPAEPAASRWKSLFECVFGGCVSRPA